MNERGYGSVLALMLLFGGMLLAGLAADVGRLVATWREVAYAARTAAESGAGWVEADALYRGELVIDVPAARAVAGGVAAGRGRRVTIEATPERVCVTVSKDTSPVVTRLVGGGIKTASATACATPRRG